jgi:23S rRNA (cytosine1962-C5)-methyltransferase
MGFKNTVRYDSVEGAIACATIHEGKEKLLLRHHPWVFSGAISGIRGPRLSEKRAMVVRVETSKARFIAYGWYDPLSHIPLRLLSWDEKVFPDDSWWARMLREAVLRRSVFFGEGGKRTNACRLVHGEADFIPGLAIDLYATTIRCLVSARIAWDHRMQVVETLHRLLRPSLIVVSTDSAFCGIEQLPERTEWYRDGVLVDPDADISSSIRFRENGLSYAIVPGAGQKSGFFCDQRLNRERVASYADGLTVLDAFSYTGGFTLNALLAGAKRVDAVDSSQSALEQLVENIALNEKQGRLPHDSLARVTVVKADVFEHLRTLGDGAYGMIILDPPKLARTRNQVVAAEKAYKDLNRLAFQKVASGGIVATFSCSGSISREHFRMVVAWAAKDADREVQILETLGQGMDHPVRLSFEESEYLKGFILRVV